MNRAHTSMRDEALMYNGMLCILHALLYQQAVGAFVRNYGRATENNIRRARAAGATNLARGALSMWDGTGKKGLSLIHI